MLQPALLALLIVLVSARPKTVCRDPGQPRDRFTLGGLGARRLGLLLLFLSCLFLLKIGDWYSRVLSLANSLALPRSCF